MPLIASEVYLYSTFHTQSVCGQKVKHMPLNSLVVVSHTDKSLKAHPFSLSSPSDVISSLLMAFLLNPVSAKIRVRAVLQAVAIVSSEFPISRGPDTIRLERSDRDCFATEETQETINQLCAD